MDQVIIGASGRRDTQSALLIEHVSGLLVSKALVPAKDKEEDRSADCNHSHDRNDGRDQTLLNQVAIVGLHGGLLLDLDDNGLSGVLHRRLDRSVGPAVLLVVGPSGPGRATV